MDRQELPPITKWLRRRKEERGVSLRSISNITGLSTDTVKRILDGETQRPSPETIKVLAAWDHRDYDELMVEAAYVGNLRSLGDDDVLTIPLLGCIPAGYPDIIERDEEHFVRLRLKEIDRRHLEQHVRRPRALIVCGDSMHGLAEDGEIVVIDPDARAVSGRMVVALVDGEPTLKTLILRDDESVLRSTNPAKYPDISIRVEERGLIQGVVVTVIPLARPRYLGPLKPPKPEDDDF